MVHMKEQDKTLEELSEMEVGNLPNKEFKVMILKMFNTWEKNGWTQWKV